MTSCRSYLALLDEAGPATEWVLISRTVSGQQVGKAVIVVTPDGWENDALDHTVEPDAWTRSAINNGRRR